MWMPKRDLPVRMSEQRAESIGIVLLGIDTTSFLSHRSPKIQPGMALMFSLVLKNSPAANAGLYFFILVKVISDSLAFSLLSDFKTSLSAVTLMIVTITPDPASGPLDVSTFPLTQV